MFTKINSAEIVVYLAAKQNKNKNVVIPMSEIIRVADALEEQDGTFRVNLGRRSFNLLREYSSRDVDYDENKVTIIDLQTPEMQRIMNQYHPDKKTMAILEQLNM